MNRGMLYLIGPELVMLSVILVVYAICARHPSGEGHDLRGLKKLLMVLPPIATALLHLPHARCCERAEAVIVASVMLLTDRSRSPEVGAGINKYVLPGRRTVGSSHSERRRRHTQESAASSPVPMLDRHD